MKFVTRSRLLYRSPIRSKAREWLVMAQEDRLAASGFRDLRLMPSGFVRPQFRSVRPYFKWVAVIVAGVHAQELPVPVAQAEVRCGLPDLVRAQK